MMISQLSQKHFSLLLQAIRAAEDLAKELNIDLSACRVEIHNHVPCKDTPCYLVHFCKELPPATDWMDTDGEDLNDICVYIAQESGQTVLVSQSR